MSGIKFFRVLGFIGIGLFGFAGNGWGKNNKYENGPETAAAAKIASQKQQEARARADRFQAQANDFAAQAAGLQNELQTVDRPDREQAAKDLLLAWGKGQDAVSNTIDDKDEKATFNIVSTEGLGLGGVDFLQDTSPLGILASRDTVRQLSSLLDVTEKATGDTPSDAAKSNDYNPKAPKIFLANSNALLAHKRAATMKLTNGQMADLVRFARGVERIPDRTPEKTSEENPSDEKSTHH